jgi:hypothetical protein
LVRAQLKGYASGTGIAIMQHVRLSFGCVRGTAIDREVASRLVEQLTNIVRDVCQLQCIGRHGGRGAGASIFKLEVKYREFDGCRRSGRDGMRGAVCAGLQGKRSGYEQRADNEAYVAALTLGIGAIHDALQLITAL